ncbi:DNA repair protein RecO [Planctomycetota bacterium]|nr:DNA repair protein RecO [Planctomycetota bacterium]
MPRIKDNAICIKHLDWSETSQIVVLFTESHGLIRGVAKGSKRNSPSLIARFSGGIELMTQGEVLATVKQTDALAAVTEWDLQKDFHPFRRKLSIQRLGCYAVDLVGHMYPEQDPHPSTYHVLRMTLEKLCGIYLQNKSCPEQLLQACILTFQYLILNDVGYAPNFEFDVQTGEILSKQSSYNFDPVAGGLTMGSTREDWRVRQSTVEVFRQIIQLVPTQTEQTSDQDEDAREDLIKLAIYTYEQVYALLSQVDPDTLIRGNRLLCSYIRALLDKQLPTMPFILGK